MIIVILTITLIIVLIKQGIDFRKEIYEFNDDYFKHDNEEL
jgi:hypothetical protein